jgi:hypothetical protein
MTKERMLQQQAMSFLSKGVNTGQWDEHVAYDLVRQMLDANWQAPEPGALLDCKNHNPAECPTCIAAWARVAENWNRGAE